MMRITFSVIIPSIGRPTLAATLDSLMAAGLSSSDEVIVIADGGAPAAHDIVRRSGLITHASVKVPDLIPQGGCWGQPARNFGMSLAHGSHLVFTQDDNMLMPHSLDGIRDDLLDDPLAIHFYRVRPQCGAVVWGQPGVSVGNIDADCGVVPNVPARLGKWGEHYNGDADFWIETASKWDDAIIWHQTLIAVNGRYYVPQEEGDG